jgi:NUMOD3 motif
MSGSGNPFFGKLHTEETKNKISVTKTGVQLSDKARTKMIGRTLSPEARAKLSAAFKGRVSPMKGKHHSIESKVKLSIANTGRSHTEETKKKLSEAR